jgi:hypothetical protein
MPSRISIPVPIRIFPAIERGRLAGSITINGEELKTRVLDIEVIRRATVGIDTAKTTVNNSGGTYTGKWKGGEEVIISFDFSAGTTVIFKGFVTAPSDISSKAPRIEVSCSGYGVQAFKNPVYENYTVSTDIGQIFATLIGKYLTGHTTAGVNLTTGITATPSWQGKDLFMCLQDLAITFGANGYDFFVDENKDWSFFAKGTKIHDDNSGIAIVYGQNLLNTKLDSAFAARRNKITVQGKDLKGQMLLATRNDYTDQNESWKMTEIVRDDNLTTQEQVEAMADYLNGIGTDVGRSGTMSCIGMPGLRPGYKVMSFDPNNNIDGYVVASEITHRISGKYINEVKIYEKVPREPVFLQAIKNIITSSQKSLNQSNQSGMENSFVMVFDDTSFLDTAQCMNVGVLQGNLVITGGFTSGIAISSSKTTSDPASRGVLAVNGSGFEDSKFYVSLTGTEPYEIVTPNELHDFTTTGSIIRVQVEMLATTERPNPSIESMGFMYK